MLKNIGKNAKKHFVFRLRSVNIISRTLVHCQRIIFSAIPSPARESESNAIKHATGFKIYKSLLKVAKCECVCLRSWLSYLSYFYLICSEIKCMCGKYYLKMWSFIISAIFPNDVICHMDTFTSSCFFHHLFLLFLCMYTYLIDFIYNNVITVMRIKLLLYMKQE